MKQNDIKRVCITGTAYNLFFNLLITPEELLPYTLYFTCDTVPSMFINKLKNTYHIEDMHHISRFRRWKYLIKFQFLRKLFAKYMDSAEIYAQDHLPYTWMLLGSRKYILTEDAPGVMTIAKGQKYVNDSWNSKHEYQQKRMTNFVLRHTNFIQGGVYGRNSLCQQVLLSNDQYADWLEYSIQKVIDLKEAWNGSSLTKKQYILNVFNVTEKDITTLKSRKVILFTQPFFEDGDVSSLDEQITIYKDALSKYDEENVVIKMHPREHTDYTKFFPKAKIFNKPVPFQLLNMLDITFETAVTICSTAVQGIDYPIKIDWIGTKNYPSLLKEYGDVKLKI